MRSLLFDSRKSKKVHCFTESVSLQFQLLSFELKLSLDICSQHIIRV